MVKLLIWWWQLSERNMHVKLEIHVLVWYIKLAWSQNDSLFQKYWSCVARIMFLFPEPGRNTRSIKVKMFSMAFWYGLCYTGRRFCCVCFTLGQGEISFCSQRGFCSRAMQFQASGVQVTLLRILLRFVGKRKARFSFCSIHQDLNIV